LAPSRWRQRLYEAGAALVLLAVIALGVVGQCWHTTRQDVADAVAEADRLDPDWRFEELEAQRQLPPPEQNSAIQVLKVKSLLPRGWPHPPPGPRGADHPDRAMWRNDPPPGKLDEPTRQIGPQHVRMLREALERAGPSLTEARKLADMPEGRYPVAWAADIDSTPCPWSDAFYSVANVLEFDGLARNRDGDSDGALLATRAWLNLGRSLGEEPFFHGAASRLGCRWRAANAIERTLAQGQPSEAALAATQKAVQREDAVSLSLAYFRGHRAMMHRFLTEVDDGKHRLSECG
jgi:hypothetical protein